MRSDNLVQQLAFGAIRTYHNKEHVFYDGDPASHVFKIEAGNICIYKMMLDGRRQVIDFAYPGDVIGLGALGKHSAGAQAMTATSARCIPTSMLHEVVKQDSRMGLKLYEAMSRELLAARELLCTVGRLSAPERLAAFLVALSRRNKRCGDNPNIIVLPMTRNDIADFLGLTIETISRTFTKFRNAGLIDLRQSVLLTISDPQTLANLAEGERRGEFSCCAKGHSAGKRRSDAATHRTALPR